VNRDRVFGWAATVAVAAGIALGLWQLGSPGSQREISLDQRRSRDLGRIASAIDRWYGREKKLPADLNSLRLFDPGLSVRDPLTSDAYEYRPGGNSIYQLCASFALASSGDDEDRLPAHRFNAHAAGRQCFDLDAARSNVAP
jgi:hypothetical protein